MNERTVFKLFQFQSGAIKSSSVSQAGEEPILFQFQSGAIKSPQTTTYFNEPLSFNSNLVRLRGTSSSVVYVSKNKFQFQSGAIKSQFCVYVLLF